MLLKLNSGFKVWFASNVSSCKVVNSYVFSVAPFDSSGISTCKKLSIMGYVSEIEFSSSVIPSTICFNSEIGKQNSINGLPILPSHLYSSALSLSASFLISIL